MTMKKTFLSIAVFIVFAVLSYSQINRGGKPFTYDSEFNRLVNEQTNKSIDINNIITVPDLNKAYEEAQIKKLTGRCNSCGDRNKIYGKDIEININFFEYALVTPIDNGELWTMKIESEKSEGFQFIFSSFYLPDGCLLYFFNEERTMHLGAFTSNNHREDGRFITQHLNGNIANIELFVPDFVTESPCLYLEKVVYIFDNVLRGGPFIVDGGAGKCNINVNCSQGWGWEKESKSVAIILLQHSDTEYRGMCTGALINKVGNYSNFERPYFLTANHCYQNPENGNISNPFDWVFLFKHESSCQGLEPISDDLTKSVTGAFIRVNDYFSSTSDYLLLELDAKVSDIIPYEISFAGWDRDINPPATKVVGIHHPKGDLKKISWSNKTVGSWHFPPEDEFPLAPNSHWEVTWSEGTTEKGSSGSPLFNNDHKIVGLLTGGNTNCDEGLLGQNYYGKISHAFSNSNFQLYLGNATTVDTYTPTGTSNYDLPLIIETIPAQVYSGSTAKVKVTANSGTVPILWNVLINKEPDDFNDYPCSNTNKCKCSGTNYGTTVYQSDDFYFPSPGTYKGKVFALDNKGRQSEVVFSIVVSENKCIWGSLRQIHPINSGHTTNLIEFPKGAKLSVQELFNVVVGCINCGVHGCTIECYTHRFTDLYTAYSTYQGIGRVVWKHNGVEVKRHDYNLGYTSMICVDVKGDYPNPDYQYEFTTQCFELNDEGTNTITVEVYGGQYAQKPDGQNEVPDHYVYELIPKKNPTTTVSMKVQVVDCNKTITLDQFLFSLLKYELLNKEINIKRGIIVVDAVTIDGNKPVNLTARSSISLKAGTKIVAGTRFSANVIGCPEYTGDCTPSKNSNEDDYGENSKSISSVSVYPNPTRDIININMSVQLSEINYYEIYDMSGKLLIQKIPENSIEQYSLQGQPNGIYMVRIVYYDCEDELIKVSLEK